VEVPDAGHVGLDGPMFQALAGHLGGKSTQDVLPGRHCQQPCPAKEQKVMYRRWLAASI